MKCTSYLFVVITLLIITSCTGGKCHKVDEIMYGIENRTSHNVTMIYYRSDYNDTTTIVANNFDYINISILYDTDSININYDNVKQKTYYTAIDPCRIARNIACESNYAPWLTECTTYYTYILNENDYLAADSIS